MDDFQTSQKLIQHFFKATSYYFNIQEGFMNNKGILSDYFKVSSKTQLKLINHIHQITVRITLLTLINVGCGGRNHPPSSEDCVFSTPEHLLDQSVNSSVSVVVQQKRTRALYLSRFSRGGPMKFESTFFQIAKLRFLKILAKSSNFQKILRG